MESIGGEVMDVAKIPGLRENSKIFRKVKCPTGGSPTYSLPLSLLLSLANFY